MIDRYLKAAVPLAVIACVLIFSLAFQDVARRGIDPLRDDWLRQRGTVVTLCVVFQCTVFLTFLCVYVQTTGLRLHQPTWPMMQSRKVLFWSTLSNVIFVGYAILDFRDHDWQGGAVCGTVVLGVVLLWVYAATGCYATPVCGWDVPGLAVLAFSGLAALLCLYVGTVRTLNAS